MKKLYLLRHAHAEEAAQGPMGDNERFLSARGLAEAETVGDFMRGNGIFPDFVLSSTSIRTVQTARTVFGRIFREEGQKVRSSFDRVLYLAPANIILQQIETVPDDVTALLVVAHNPGIAELAEFLGCPSGQFVPATLAMFSVPDAGWNDIGPDTVRMEKLFAP